MSRNACSSRSSGTSCVICQTMTTADSTSTVESNPNPTRAVEEATAPATIATTASIVFQAIVAHANPSAIRWRRRRSGSAARSRTCTAIACPLRATADPRRSPMRGSGEISSRGSRACSGSQGRKGTRGSRRQTSPFLLFLIVATSRQVKRRKDSKRVAETWIGKVVADASSLRSGGHEATLTQTGEVVRQVGSGGVEGVGHLAGIRGAVKECDEDAAPGGVRERETDAAKRPEVQCRCRYSHSCTIQQPLKFANQYGAWHGTPIARTACLPPVGPSAQNDAARDRQFGIGAGALLAPRGSNGGTLLAPHENRLIDDPPGCCGSRGRPGWHPRRGTVPQVHGRAVSRVRRAKPAMGDGEDHRRQSHHELARLMSPRRRSAGEPGPPGRSRRIGGRSFGTGVDRRRRPRQIVRSQHAAGAGRGYARGGTRSWSTSVSVSHVSYRSGGQPRSTTSSPYTSGDTRAWMMSPASRSRSVGRNARARANARATRP